MPACAMADRPPLSGEIAVLSDVRGAAGEKKIGGRGGPDNVTEKEMGKGRGIDVCLIVWIVLLNIRDVCYGY